MKRAKLFNAPLSSVIARMGHTDQITLCDAGLPIYEGPERVDLALWQGTPSFLDVLQAMATELQIEKIIIANEMATVSPDFKKKFEKVLEEIGQAQGGAIAVESIPHVDFKKMTAQSRAIVRSGECTYYANAIIQCGVSF